MFSVRESLRERIRELDRRNEKLPTRLRWFLESLQRDYVIEFDTNANCYRDCDDNVIDANTISIIRRDYNALIVNRDNRSIALNDDVRVSRLFVALALTNVDWNTLSIRRSTNNDDDSIIVRVQRDAYDSRRDVLTLIVNAFANYDCVASLAIDSRIDDYANATLTI